MAYLESLNGEIREYFNILSDGKWPSFIDKYIETSELQRLAGIGLFCGMDYTDVDVVKPGYWYSRLDHSIACALITWTMTGDKAQTLSALFHDLGTPAFSHAVDFMLGDGNSQTSSEKKIVDVIGMSKEINDYLIDDNIQLEHVVNAKNYPIVDNEIPCLCVDRLEGIMSTGLIWGKFWNLEDIKEIYEMVGVIEYDEHSWFQTATGYFEPELGLIDNDPEKFFKGIIRYSLLLQTKESKFCMRLLGDILKVMVKEKIINLDDLYNLSESQIIKIIKNSHQKELWNEFTKLSKVYKVSIKDNEKYCCEVSTKKRFCDPLVCTPYGAERLSCISGEALDDNLILLKHIRAEKNTYVTAKLSDESVKVLKQY